MADQLKPRLAVDQHHEFARERRDRNIGVRPEAALARKADPGLRINLEYGFDLGAGGVELRSAARDLAAEGAEPVGVEPWGNPHGEAERTF